MDPAGPLFDANSPINRLASTDAEYVEVIHTDTQQLGIAFPIGHADFYPNGGTGMPGCFSKISCKLYCYCTLKCFSLAAICDHNLVVNYYVETLNSDRLWGRRCTNLAEMQADRCTGFGASMGGEPSNFRNNLVGVFRMRTNANSPFGIGTF